MVSYLSTGQCWMVSLISVIISMFYSTSPSHLEKKGIGQLLDGIAVINSVVSQGMADPQEFTYGISHGFLSLCF